MSNRNIHEDLIRNFSTNSGVAILCDFDGTITRVNVLNTLYKHFSLSNFQDLIQQWERREISTVEEIETSFSNVTANKSEMENVLEEITIDPHLSSLLKTCEQEGFNFAIVSDGLRWYIDYILSKHGINDIDIYANEVRFSESGITFEFPWYDPSTPLQGTSKSRIVRKFQENGNKVIFIGDGISDTSAALVADYLFARDFLLEFSRENEINAYQFNDLKDVEINLKAMIQRQNKSGGFNL